MPSLKRVFARWQVLFLFYFPEGSIIVPALSKNGGIGKEHSTFANSGRSLLLRSFHAQYLF
jgi:hypothetical protein